MVEALRQDRQTRFTDVPDSGLQIDTAGTFEDPEQAERWRLQVQEAFPNAVVEYSHLPCSIACHVGRNAAGIAITKKEA